jgi:hypothetical protein
LYGTSLYLRADFQGAKEAYQNSLTLFPLPAGFETTLKLAALFVDFGTEEEVLRTNSTFLISLLSASQFMSKWLSV